MEIGMIAVIDALRAELKRQAKDSAELSVATIPTDKPDTMRVMGLVDLDALAKAVHSL